MAWELFAPAFRVLIQSKRAGRQPICENVIVKTVMQVNVLVCLVIIIFQQEPLLKRDFLQEVLEQQSCFATPKVQVSAAGEVGFSLVHKFAYLKFKKTCSKIQ